MTRKIDNDWLTLDPRYKQLELGVFMYAIVSLGVTFICYTGRENFPF